MTSSSVVTGALGGMGKEISMELARQGGAVVLVARDVARGEALVQTIRNATGNKSVELVPIDFTSLASVRKGAADIAARHRDIKLLSHNAAVYSSTRKTTADGHELMFGVNHLAPFLLTRLLRPSMPRGARVVFNSGPWKNHIDFANLESESFKALDAFGRSKSANNLVALELAKRDADICTNAVDPGFVKSTLTREAPAPLRLVFALIGQSQKDGARWPLHAATDPHLDGVSGKFFVKGHEKPWQQCALDDAARARLWSETERILGLA